jgi:AAA15 family ATPase/GTPase
MNETFFKNIHISNFKSLKEVTLSDCKRINLLIGKPNVGKSNILEAIGLFSLPCYHFSSLTNLVRLEKSNELFFDGNIDKQITICIDNNVFCTVDYLEWSIVRFEILRYKKESGSLVEESIIDKDKSYITRINSSLNFISNTENIQPSSEVKYYKFPHHFNLESQGTRHSYLLPPSGVNLLDVLQESKLNKELNGIFSEYGFKLLFDKTNNSLRIMKTLKDDNTMVSFPFSSIADTLQRVIFFKAAIASNQNSILLFEEPEAHCFPPYIAHFTQDVLDSETNQFFIATHSPYVLNDFLESQRDDVAIFMADFKEGQTVIYRLTDDEVNEVYNDGIDVFFNYERYTQHG